MLNLVYYIIISVYPVSSLQLLSHITSLCHFHPINNTILFYNLPVILTFIILNNSTLSLYLRRHRSTAFSKGYLRRRDGIHTHRAHSNRVRLSRPLLNVNDRVHNRTCLGVILGAINNSRTAHSQHAPLNINGAAVERVRSTKFLGVHITENLSWTSNTSSLAKKAHQRLYFLRKLRRATAPTPIMCSFYRGTRTAESGLADSKTVLLLRLSGI
ncbi:uncharacterized protein LOC133486863 [Phyllopteryx taeniolatus]|uniref:uncharacterized protein LOC133486863 n=1 Tax=Phyllopteryx taeniolatus TaxID=161469 RepID=UPI002AD317A3|nr:uncharacterized protein LOC133486863 [Phyllopteryx taeniolatus]